ncbi:MAG TPA: DUF4080 domain-containing protein, partial [Chromatiales bacterium]|nr:DUF4080 domain-containing protein [Chromatiales bacterium]
VALLKQVSPETIIVLGGPEVSFEHDQQPIVAMADYVICGAADLEFAELCRELLAGRPPPHKIINAIPFRLSELKLPYYLYSDEDIKNRLIYVEASRGCPFKCEFCLSALDKSAKPFDQAQFLNEMQLLYERGARHFKFIDRTFNLKIKDSIRIMAFFLARMSDDLFLHFELIPDHLPEALREMIQRFPEGSLQFEVGIQSFNPEVQALISRRQDNRKSAENLSWIRNNSHAHIHADLIIGLPGEDINSFAAGFNRLATLNPHEIQVGILKRLRGTPLVRHTEEYEMRYNPNPPYNILSTSRIDFLTMQRLNRFARYWEMISNSGRFRKALVLVLADNAFEGFIRLSDWLFKETGQTHRLALKRLFELLHRYLTEEAGVSNEEATAVLRQDHQASGQSSVPAFLIEQPSQQQKKLSKRSLERRQARHRESGRKEPCA